MTEEQLNLLFYELHRIGNALEVLAVEASPDYYPTDEAIRRYQVERRQKAEGLAKSPGPRE